MAPKKASQSGSDFTLISSYPLGYRSREDQTMLPPGVMVPGSQNVLTNVQGRIQSRRGYTLDGASNASNAPILGAFDWPRHVGDTRHMRSGFNSSGSNGKLQFRYVDDDDNVTWIDLLTGLSSSRFNFTNFWDANDELTDMLLMVNGSNTIYEWSGAVATWESATNAAGVISVLNATPTAAGTGYVVGDVLTITTGGTGATATVATIGALGAVASVVLTTPGSGYTTGAGKATSGGTGTGCTLNITTIVTGYVKIEGTSSVSELGFYKDSANLPGSITIWDTTFTTGTTFTYSGVVNGYFVGMSADASGYVAGNVIAQTVKSVTSFSGLPSSGFVYDLIATLNNQIYVGCLTSNNVYVSKQNNYEDYTFATPRAPGEGALFYLDGACVGLIPQESSMYITAGKDQWYETQFQLSADLTDESLTITRLKTTANQASQSQAFITKIRDNVAFLSNEPIMSTLGRVNNVVLTPQISDISYSIVNDMSQYDFTDGSAFYAKNFLYVCVPQEGIVRIYNMTNEQVDANGMRQFYWEAPQILPISRFSLIDGELYGHSYLTSETYKMFDGFNDNGNPIASRATFSYNQYGVRDQTKSYNDFYVEGYISANTALTLGITYDIDGCATQTAYTINGSDTQIVCIGSNYNSLGKFAIGKQPLGGNQADIEGTDVLPPKFRVIKTFTRVPFYEDQISFSSTGDDENWQIIAFGPAVSLTTENQAPITQ